MAWAITKNLAQSSLASGYTAGDSSITVQTGDGSKFDAPGGGSTIAIAIGKPTQFLLRATAVSGDTFTVDTSGFDGSTAVSAAMGSAVTQVITAGVLSDLLAAAGGGGSLFWGAATATAGQIRNIITLGSTPEAGSLQIFVNRAAGGTDSYVPTIDFSVSGTTVTLSNNLLTGDVAVCYWSTTNSTPGGITLSGGTTPPALRGTNILAQSASSFTINFPTGSLAGDMAVLFATNGFSVTTPSGWTQTFNSGSASQWNGLVAWKILSALDITNGSVTVAMGGTFDGVVAIATFVGDTAGIRETDASQNSSGSSTINVSTTSGVLTSDCLLLFGSNRATSTNTCNVGTQEETAQSAGGNGSASLYFETPAASGVTTATFSYSSAGLGNMQAIVVVRGA